MEVAKQMRGAIYLLLSFLAGINAHAGQLAFDGSFNGYLSSHIASDWTPIPPGQWICHTPSAADYGDAYFTGVLEKDSLGNSINPFSLKDGHLVIKASQDPTISNHWRSGMISSIDINGHGFSHALGHWEARIFLPSGLGVWPSFWLESANVIQRSARTSNAAEIDVMEMYGVDMTKLHQRIHVWTPQSKDVGQAEGGTTVTINPSGWHTFGVQINTDYVHWFFDGTETFKFPTDPSMLQPMFGMVSFALGGGWPVNMASPTYMLVNYVRYYAP